MLPSNFSELRLYNQTMIPNFSIKSELTQDPLTRPRDRVAPEKCAATPAAVAARSHHGMHGTVDDDAPPHLSLWSCGPSRPVPGASSAL